MKVLGITGSPREKSNTEYYVNFTLRELEKKGLETELLRVREKDINHCQGCYYCVENRECKQKDDFQEVFQKMIGADGFIIGSPVYHSAPTPLLKALLDRAGFLGRWVENEMKSSGQEYEWSGTAFSGKVAAPITVARRSGHSFAFSELLLWLTVNDFIVVGSNYWNVGVAGKGGSVDADQDEEGLSIMKHLARNMARVMKSL